MKIIRIISLVLLLINGFGAFLGGFAMITDPTGASLQLCLDCLHNSPFANYFIPGLILLLANGVSSFIAFGAVMVKYKYYPWLMMVQGSILTGWIAIQMIMLQVTYFLHFIFGGMGILLIIFAIILVKHQKNNPRSNMFWSYFRVQQ